MRGQFRADLGGVSVNGLLAAQDQAHVPQRPDRAGQRVGGGPGVRAGEGPVSQQDSLVAAPRDALAHGGLCLERPHGQGGHAPLRKLLLQCDGRLDRVGVQRVQDAGHALADEGAALGVNAHLGGVRDVLDADDDVHGNPPVELERAEGN